MNKMRYTLYTQGKNECTLRTILNIIRTKYWIIFNEVQFEKMKKQAEKDKIWSAENWAIFDFVYNWATWYLFKELWVQFNVLVYNINGSEFQKAFDEWESFGLWLLYANSWYSSAKSDEKLTLEEIKNAEVDKMKFMGHNLCFKLWYLIDTIWKQVIKFELEALKEAVKKEIFWSKARTFEIKDELIDEYLIQLNRWTVYNRIELLTETHKKALDKALELRNFYRK